MESNNKTNNNHNWMEEENNRATDLAKTGKTLNNQAPRLVAKKKAAPSRMVRSIFIQPHYSQGFDKLIFDQKLQNGKTAPELMEEAIELVLKKYKIEF